jgi:sugar phosphate permease
MWVANLQTIPTDLFHPSEVGTVTGFSGMGGTAGGALANLRTGCVVMHISYAPVFLLAGLMHLLVGDSNVRFTSRRSLRKIWPVDFTR